MYRNGQNGQTLSSRLDQRATPPTTIRMGQANTRCVIMQAMKSTRIVKALGPQPAPVIIEKSDIDSYRYCYQNIQEYGQLDNAIFVSLLTCGFTTGALMSLFITSLGDMESLRLLVIFSIFLIVVGGIGMVCVVYGAYRVALESRSNVQ